MTELECENVKRVIVTPTKKATVGLPLADSHDAAKCPNILEHSNWCTLL